MHVGVNKPWRQITALKVYARVCRQTIIDADDIAFVYGNGRTVQHAAAEKIHYPAIVEV